MTTFFHTISSVYHNTVKLWLETTGGILFFILMLGYQAHAQTSMMDCPEGSYTSYFQYFRFGDNSMPSGADNTAKAIIGMEVLAARVTGTGFLINTYRHDRKVCMLTAGHVIDALDGLMIPGEPIVFNAYMKYWGKNSTVYPGLNVTTSGYKSTVHAELLANAMPDADIALLLVDESELSLRNPTTLGYSFEKINTGSFFSSYGHPSSMPLKVGDNLSLNGPPDTGQPNERLLLHSSGNNNMGPGASGGPALLKGPSISPAIGVLSASFGNNFTVPDNELMGMDDDIEYDNSHYIAKIAAISSTIKTHCWQTKTDSALLSSGEFKITGTLDHTASMEDYTRPLQPTSASQLKGQSDAGYKASNPGCILLKASTLSLSFPIAPDADTRKIYALAKEVNLNNGFSYTSTANYVLDLNSAVPELTGSTPISLNYPGWTTTEQDSASQYGFSVSPNPNPTGLFTVEAPLASSVDGYLMQITTTDGRAVINNKAIAPGAKARIDLSGKPRGVYLLSIYERGQLVSYTKLVYQ